MTKLFDYKIEDTFANYNTKSLLCGKTFTEYHKQILMNVIKYYASKNFKGHTETEQHIIEYLESVFEYKPDISFDELKRLFSATSNECLLAYILIAYNDQNLDLILRCMYTFCRVLPFENSTEWYDNYRLNNYGNPLNMIVRSKYDCPEVYSLTNSDPIPINKSVKLDFNKVVKRLVGSVRAFIIDHEIYPNETKNIQQNTKRQQINIQHNSKSKTSRNKNKQKNLNMQDIYSNYIRKFNIKGGDIEKYTTDNYVHEFREGKHDDLSLNKTAEQICDECYERYVYYFGGAHGCDVFDTYLSLSIEELKMFFERYPSAKVGYILNTATYASGRGEHWIALELSKGKAKLICSQASDFSAFHDNDKLDLALQQNMFGQEHNIVRFQEDSYSCGIFSALSLYELLMTGDINKAVDRIGTNGEKLKNNKDINDIREIWAGTTH